MPWARGATLAFNDTAASTLSTVGNAALLLGGLYLLSGFPAAAALADPFGFSRRLGIAPATGRPGPPPPVFQHRSSNGQKETFMKKSKMEKEMRRRPSKDMKKRPGKTAVFNPMHQQKAVNRQLPLVHGAMEEAKKSKPQERQQRPNPTPNRFRIQLPTFRMPQLPALRGPRFPLLPSNPFGRPAPLRVAPTPNRPRPSASAPARRPAPQPATQAAPVFRPSTPAATRRPVPSRPVSQRAPVRAAPVTQRAPAPAPARAPAPPQQSQQLRTPAAAAAPAANFPNSDFSPFGGGADPFGEFQSSK